MWFVFNNIERGFQIKIKIGFGLYKKWFVYVCSIICCNFQIGNNIKYILFDEWMNIIWFMYVIEYFLVIKQKNVIFK